MPRRLLGLVLVIGVTSCARRGPASAARDQQLATLDAGWPDGPVDEASVPEEARLRDDLERLATIRIREPTDPAWAWREVRVLVGLGLHAPDAPTARRWWARARSVGTACTTAGLRLDLDALREARLPAGRRVCAAWAADAWSRWVARWDHAATAVDHEAVRGLAEVGRSAPDPHARIAVAGEGRLDQARLGVVGQSPPTAPGGGTD